MRTVKEIEKDIAECNRKFDELLREKREATAEEDRLVNYKGKYIKYVEESYTYYMYVEEFKYSEWSRTYYLTGMVITEYCAKPEVALHNTICIDRDTGAVEEIHKDSFILKYNEVIQILNNEINNWK